MRGEAVLYGCFDTPSRSRHVSTGVGRPDAIVSDSLKNGVYGVGHRGFAWPAADRVAGAVSCVIPFVDRPD